MTPYGRGELILQISKEYCLLTARNLPTAQAELIPGSWTAVWSVGIGVSFGLDRVSHISWSLWTGLDPLCPPALRLEMRTTIPHFDVGAGI